MAQITKPKQPCVHCQTPVKKKVCPFKLNKLNKAYFYTHTLHCEGCGAVYNIDSCKITRAEVLEVLTNNL